MNINMSVFAGDPGWLIFGRVFFLLSMPAMMAAVLIYGFRELKRRRKAYRRISEFLRECGKLVDGIPTVHHREIDFTLRFFGNRRQQPAGLWILSECGESGSFKVRKKNLLEKRFKCFGFGEKIQTGDPAFDNGCCVSTDTAALASAYLESSLKRDRIGTLFVMGFKILKLDQNRLSIKLAPLTVLAEKDPAFLLDAMGCLVDLVKDYPRSDPKG